MTAPYIALALTGIPAAYRTRGFLRWWITFEVTATILLKLIWLRCHVYDPLWRVAEPVSMALAAAVVLERARTDRWPFYALAAGVVHGWAMSYPEKWPGSWLQLEVHVLAFVSLMMGLLMVTGRKHAPIAALLLLTAAAYYAAPWNPGVRVWLMYLQAGCYLWVALLTERSIPQRAGREPGTAPKPTPLPGQPRSRKSAIPNTRGPGYIAEVGLALEYWTSG